MIKNIVFKGGGVLGIAYAGTLEVLEQRGVTQNLQRVAGASAGAITALLVALRYSASEIKEIIGKTSFRIFEDGDIFDQLDAIQKYGIHPGKALQNWAESLVVPKLGPKATFAQLRSAGYPDLHVVTCSYDTEDVAILSADTTPSVILSEAIRASASIPGFFYAFPFSTDTDQVLHIDGGTVCNFPLTIFDNVCGDQETLGVYLTPSSDPALPTLKFGQPGEAVKRLFEAALNAQNADFFGDPDQVKRTIIIKHPTQSTAGGSLSAITFDLTEQDQVNLFNAGVEAATEYFSNPQNIPK